MGFLVSLECASSYSVSFNMANLVQMVRAIMDLEMWLTVLFIVFVLVPWGSDEEPMRRYTRRKKYNSR